MRAVGALFGYAVASEIPLERLAPGPGERGSVRIARTGAPHAGGGTVVHEQRSGTTVFTLERRGSRLVARCSQTGTYLLDPEAATVEACQAAAQEIFEHRLLSMAIPLLLAERGDLALHASALVADGQAIAFAGRSGRGKSTIASAGALLGYRLLAEDGAVATVEGDAVLAWPGPLGIRAGDERTIVPTAPERHARRPERLAALVLLGERSPGGLACERLEPAAAVPAVLPTLIFGGSDRLREALAAAARIAERVPVYRVSMPDRLAALPGALETVVGVAANGR